MFIWSSVTWLTVVLQHKRWKRKRWTFTVLNQSPSHKIRIEQQRNTNIKILYLCILHVKGVSRHLPFWSLVILWWWIVVMFLSAWTACRCGFRQWARPSLDGWFCIWKVWAEWDIGRIESWIHVMWRTQLVTHCSVLVRWRKLLTFAFCICMCNQPPSLQRFQEIICLKNKVFRYNGNNRFTCNRIDILRTWEPAIHDEYHIINIHDE